MDERVPPTGRVEPQPGGYAAHIEDEKGLLETPAGGFGTAEEAIAWCRARAEIVVVRLAGDDVLRSAGGRPPPWAPEMPPLVRQDAPDA